MSVEVVELTMDEVTLVRALSYSEGTKTSGSVRPGDELRETLHRGVRVNGEIVAVGTVNRDPSPRNPHVPVWRIRGMATLKDHRSHGYGSDILRYFVDHIAENGGGLLWGDLRVPSIPFYERHGFGVQDDVYATSTGVLHRYGDLLIPGR